jgi:hypothetical protein
MKRLICAKNLTFFKTNRYLYNVYRLTFTSKSILNKFNSTEKIDKKIIPDFQKNQRFTEKPEETPDGVYDHFTRKFNFL